jgi:hypothetical protein
MEEIEVVVADAMHEKYVDTILETIAEAAKVRGTGIAKRSHEYVAVFLARMRRLHQCGRAETHQPQILHLHGYALRPGRTSARETSSGCAGKNS